MMPRICSTVTVFPSLSLMSARPSLRLTFTESTPLTFLMATLTAWAQTAQSIPKIFWRSSLSSAVATAGMIHPSRPTKMLTRFMLRSFSKPVGEIHDEAEAISVLSPVQIAVHGEQRSAGDAPRAVQAQDSRPDEYL